MIRKNKSPWFGAAYYPEAWDEKTIDEDIKLMGKANMNVMRLGEFAWSSMERSEGVYTFEWLDSVIAKLNNASIAVILGTPSATPPIWLTSKYPEMLTINDSNVRAQHGGRRHCCSNNPQYIKHTKSIVAKMAQRYSKNESIIGWQIDNEICYKDRGCYCEYCVDGYHKYLEKKYKTIEELNERLCLTLWSMEYQTFEQIPAPAKRTFAHPSLITDWFTFQSLSNAEFVSMQANILREKNVKVPIGTDMMPILEQDYITTNKDMDVIQFNHYHDQTNLYSLIFWNDYIRNLKDRPFWITETSPCWNGSSYPRGDRPKGFCTANTWISYAMGAENSMYWLWRSHRAGQEMMHGSVISSAGRPLHIFGEVKNIGENLEKVKDVLTNSKVKSTGIAIHLSHNANNTFIGQAISKGMEGQGAYINNIIDNFYKPLLENQLRPDIIDPIAELSKYKIIITPFLPFLNESGLLDKIVDWVKKGGVWVVGPLTDIRKEDGTKFTHAPLGNLEELAGVKLIYQIPADGNQIQCDGYEAMQGTDVISLYNEYPIKGLAEITNRKMGNGSIYILGTVPSQKVFTELMLDITKKVGVKPAAIAQSNILSVKRTNKKNTTFYIEYKGLMGSIKLESKKADLLSGKQYSGDVSLKPFEVLCVEDIV